MGLDWDREPDRPESGLRSAVRLSRDFCVEQWNDGGIAFAVRLGCLALTAAGLLILLGRQNLLSPPPAVQPGPVAVPRAPVKPIAPPSYRFLPRPSNSLVTTANLTLPLEVAPGPICEVISSGGPVATWSPSVVYPGEWECLSNVDLAVQGGGPPKSSPVAKEAEPPVSPTGPLLFAMARGSTEGMVNYVRLKLSVNSQAEAERGSEELETRTRKLFNAVGRSAPEKLLQAVRALEPAKLEDNGVNVRFFREVMVEGRYNLVLTLPAAPPAPSDTDIDAPKG